MPSCVHHAATKLATLAILMMTVTAAQADFDRLEPDQVVAGFRTEAVYENELGAAVGARFQHTSSGFVLDLLRIQSVPQAFMWVNSFPPSDQGEPHTCEHLLLGKGTKGRYVASLEDMALGSSSAFTMQLQTCYHYHTAAGTDVFFQLMQEKLDAMLHPNFSDEEIRREVCNIGYSVDPSDSSLRLEEKGTVYNEMVSSYERPWGNLSRELDELLYGKGHPMAYSSGGYPDAIRTMTPDDMRNFHRESYHLGNMGMIVAIPDEIDLEECLKRTAAVLAAVQPASELGTDAADAEKRLPAPQSGPAGVIRVASFPNQNEKEPGLLLFAWPPRLDPSNQESYLLDLLLANLAGDETSNLYKLFIDSRTRVMDVGANAVFGWASSDQGHPVYIGLNNIKREAAQPDEIRKIRRVVTDEIARIASWPDGSEELSQFNKRALNRIKEQRRSLRKFLNSPPGFGFRGTGSNWYEHLKHLQKEPTFRKRLTLDSELDFAAGLLASGRNLWKPYIEQWGLSGSEPYAAATKADPDMLRAGEEARALRIAAFVDELKRRFGVTDEQEAIRRYRDEYDAATAVIEGEAAGIPMPKFVSNPPMTLDDQLRYSVDQLQGRLPLVTSQFDNITSATVGLALRLDVLPESLLVFVPALPSLLSDAGVIRDGRAVSYDDMVEALRDEILSLQTYITVNHRTERAELIVKAAGSDQAEGKRALEWLQLVLFSPNWTPDNVARIRDVVDLALKSRRNTMRRSEESWVQDPANAYWKQSNPLLLSAGCFLTQAHALQRLRWMLKEADSPEDLQTFTAFMKAFVEASRGLDRDGLTELMTRLAQTGEDGGSGDPLVERYRKLSAPVALLVDAAVEDLAQNLGDIPDASLKGDFAYLCDRMTTDLAVRSRDVLSRLSDVLGLLRKRDNVRAFMIASTENCAALTPELEARLAGLSAQPSVRAAYGTERRVTARLKQRSPAGAEPVYVGLMNENTRSGVFVNTAPCASYDDTDPETTLKFLSARLYGGGGAHSMFMKTWGAGLAYSNGLRSNESSGRLIYYAERCPDLAQTMQFVVDELKRAPYDTSLAEYAIAQAFSAFRSGSGYEQRGEAMAADLADGLTPDKVRRFRQAVLAQRDQADLYEQLHERMESTYGEVLPGYGPMAADVQDGVNFVIGPEKQMQSYEQYLHGVEGPTTLYRLYPRDFWLVPEGE